MLARIDSRTEFISGNIKIYFNLISSLNIEMAPLVETSLMEDKGPFIGPHKGPA